MEEILNFIADNRVVTIILAAAVVAAVVVLVIVSAKKKQKKRDKEYAEMFKEIPIVNDAGEENAANEARPEFAVHEMDWLKGERGFEGVLRTKLPPVKEQAGTVETDNAEPKNAEPENAESENAATATGEAAKIPKKQKKADRKADNEPKKKITAESDKKAGAVLSAQLSIDDFAGKNASSPGDANANADAPESVKTENTEEKKMKKENVNSKPLNAETKKPAEKTATDKKTLGKWIIKEKGDGEFVAYLYANNKELMLTSETYSSSDGAKKGIATIRKNAAVDENFTYYHDKNKNYFFKLKTSKNRFLCAGETYANKTACLKSIESVKKFVDSPLAEKVEKDHTVINYTPGQDATYTPRKNSGKWVISELDDETFFAQLFASNGELLLSSESYASYSSAKDAVENITQNGLNGNFIIDSDKKGRYFFKIRNAQKLTLCVGETYSQLSACQSAIESVFAFLKTAKLAEGK